MDTIPKGNKEVKYQSAMESLYRWLGLVKKIDYHVDPTVPQDEVVNTRGLSLKRSEFDSVFKPIYFGEVSNRDEDKKDLEGRVILNTALNRMGEYKTRGSEKSLSDVMTAPNQYQAYQGKQYQNYTTSTLDELGMKKKQQVDSIADKYWNELKSGSFEDNTQGAAFYIHNPDGSITYDNNRKLFK